MQSYKGADKAYSSITLKATVKPKKSAKVKFTTSNKKIATVSAKGVVKAKKAGKVTITAKAGNKKTVCKITVKKVSKRIKKITVKKSTVTVTEHTLRSYSTYIRSYLDYLQNILHKPPEDGFLAGTPRLHQMDSKRTESCGQNHQYSYFTASFLYHLCFT